MDSFKENKEFYQSLFKKYDKLVITDLNRYGDKDFKEMVLDPKDYKELEEAYAYVKYIANLFDIRRAALLTGPLELDAETSANYKLIKRIDDYSKFDNKTTPKDFITGIYSDINFYAELFFEDELLSNNPPSMEEAFYEEIWEKVEDESLGEDTKESDKKKELINIAEKEYIDKGSIIRNNLVQFSKAFCSYWQEYKQNREKLKK